MTEGIVIGWHRIAWQMVRHLCGPHRATEHEMGDRYRKARIRARAAFQAARDNIGEEA